MSLNGHNYISKRVFNSQQSSDEDDNGRNSTPAEADTSKAKNEPYTLDEAWQLIATKLDQPVEACKERFRRLRQYYSRERQARTNGRRGNFVYYDEMQFLDPFIMKRKSFTRKQANNTSNCTQALDEDTTSSVFGTVEESIVQDVSGNILPDDMIIDSYNTNSESNKENEGSINEDSNKRLLDGHEQSISALSESETSTLDKFSHSVEDVENNFEIDEQVEINKSRTALVNLSNTSTFLQQQSVLPIQPSCSYHLDLDKNQSVQALQKQKEDEQKLLKKKRLQQLIEQTGSYVTTKLRIITDDEKKCTMIGSIMQVLYRPTKKKNIDHC